jgi:hypothetical protein
MPAVEASLRKSRRAVEALARDRSRQRAKLVTAAERKAAARLSSEARTEWQKASLLARLDADARAAKKVTARQALERKLGRTIRRYPELRKTQRAYLANTGRAARELFKSGPRESAFLDWGPIRWPILPPLPSVPPTTFTAPFSRFDVETGDFHDLVVADNSFALPDAGHLIQNFRFAHNESAWGVSSNANFADQLTSCGVDYLLTETGRLQVSAEIENLANRLTVSITDNFGFSHSWLMMTVDLFIGLVRPGRPMDFFPVRVLASHVDSDGDDVHRSISDLDNAVPFGVGAVSTFPIPAGETVTVLAGGHVRIDSDTDDMDAHVTATFWWRLRKLTVGVI